MRDMHRRSAEQLAAMRDNILNLKRDAVIRAAKMYYDHLQISAPQVLLKEMWRTVYYNVCDLVQEETRHG